MSDLSVIRNLEAPWMRTELLRAPSAAFTVNDLYALSLCSWRHWRKAMRVKLGDVVLPTIDETSDSLPGGAGTAGLKMMVATAVTGDYPVTGLTEPSWNSTTQGTTFADGDVTWTARDIIHYDGTAGDDLADGSKATPRKLCNSVAGSGVTSGVMHRLKRGTQAGNLLFARGDTTFPTFFTAYGSLDQPLPVAGATGQAPWDLGNITRGNTRTELISLTRGAGGYRASWWTQDRSVAQANGQIKNVALRGCIIGASSTLNNAAGAVYFSTSAAVSSIGWAGQFGYWPYTGCVVEYNLFVGDVRGYYVASAASEQRGLMIRGNRCIATCGNDLANSYWGLSNYPFTTEATSAWGTSVAWTSVSGNVYRAPFAAPVFGVTKIGVVTAGYSSLKPGASTSVNAGEFFWEGGATTLSVGASGGATSLTVADASQLKDAMAVWVLLDSGAYHKTTISGAPVGNVVTVAAALPSAAASGKSVGGGMLYVDFGVAGTPPTGITSSGGGLKFALSYSSAHYWHNEVSGVTDSTGSDGYGIGPDSVATDCTLIGNYVHDCDGGGIICHQGQGHQLYGNVTERNGAALTYRRDITAVSCCNVVVAHNTSQTTSTVPNFEFAYGRDIIFSDNLAVGGERALKITDATVNQGINHYWDTIAGSLSGGATGDPKIERVFPFRPTLGSPLIGAGSVAGVARDYRGRTFAGRPNIGHSSKAAVPPVLRAASAGSYYFNGSTQHVSLGTGAGTRLAQAMDRFTIEAWIKAFDVDGGFVFGKGTSGGGDGYSLRLGGTGQLVLRGVTGGDVVSVASIPARDYVPRWCHIAVTVEPGLVTFWANGRVLEQQAVTRSAPASPTIGAFIGSTHGGASAANNLAGHINAVRVFEAVMDVRRLYRQGAYDRTALIGEWLVAPLLPDANVVPDTSGQGNNGTPVNLSGQVTASRPHNPARMRSGPTSLVFNGADRQVTIGSALTTALQGVRGLSVFGWARPQLIGDGTRVIASLRNGAGGAAFELRLNTSSQWLEAFVRGVNGDAGAVVAAGNVPGQSVLDRRWGHWGASYDFESKVMLLFFNGVCIARSAGVATSGNSYGCTPGATYIGSTGGGFHFRGLLDDIQVFDRPLSLEEAANVFAGAAMGPLARWRFDEITGTTSVDDTGRSSGTHNTSYVRMAA